MERNLRVSLKVKRARVTKFSDILIIQNVSQNTVYSVKRNTNHPSFLRGVPKVLIYIYILVLNNCKQFSALKKPKTSKSLKSGMLSH